LGSAGGCAASLIAITDADAPPGGIALDEKQSAKEHTAITGQKRDSRGDNRHHATPEWMKTQNSSSGFTIRWVVEELSEQRTLNRRQ
jgi:hypothetical protein